MHYSNTVLIWYRCINVLWHHRYWSIMVQRLMWEGLPRSAETPSMVQEKGIPRRKPTHHGATALSRQPKLVVWEKCCKQIIQSKSPLPATRITGKNKSHINCKCQQCKMWLIFKMLFLPPENIFFISPLWWKNKFTKVLHHTRNSLFTLATDILNIRTVEDKALSSEDSGGSFSSPSPMCQH